MTTKPIILGNTVKDAATGYTGIAVSRASYLQGCDRISVQAPIDENGKKPAWETFDEPDLDTIDEGVTARYAHLQTEAQKQRGGPREIPAQREW